MKLTRIIDKNKLRRTALIKSKDFQEYGSIMTRMTKEIFEQAIEISLPTIEKLIKDNVVDRTHLHIYAGGVKEGVIAEKSIGCPVEGGDEIEQIALSKFKLTQEHRMPTRDIQQKKPHVLGVPGTTIWWGSWIESDIVVACSGVQAWMDEMISKLVVSIILALMYQKQDDEFTAVEASGKSFY